MSKAAALIPDEKIFKVHGNANFGATTPRRVLKKGVICAALGYHVGSTMRAILREHKLIKKSGALTKKGYAYAQALWGDGDFR